MRNCKLSYICTIHFVSREELLNVVLSLSKCQQFHSQQKKKCQQLLILIKRNSFSKKKEKRKEILKINK